MNKLVAGFILLTIIFAGCQPSAVPGDCEPTWAFTHVDVIPMSQGGVLPDQTVVIENGLIVDLGPTSAINIPNCASVIEGDGAYLMPGLADMHVHIYEESLTEWPLSPMLLNLAYGVTTIRDAGANPIQGGRDGSFVLELRAQIEAGEVIGPTILTPGLIVRGYPPPIVEINSRVNTGFDYRP
jgi:imidazolonepropionase-like amidohydrolase